MKRLAVINALTLLVSGLWASAQAGPGGIGSVRVGLAAQARASVTMTARDLQSDYPLISPRRGKMVGDVNGVGTKIVITVGKGDARLEKE